METEEGWRSALEETGEQSAMRTGMVLMLRWFVNNLDLEQQVYTCPCKQYKMMAIHDCKLLCFFIKELLPTLVPTMVQALVLYT